MRMSKHEVDGGMPDRFMINIDYVDYVLGKKCTRNVWTANLWQLIKNSQQFPKLTMAMATAYSWEMGSFCEIIDNWDKWPTSAASATAIREQSESKQGQCKKYVARLNPKIRPSMNNLGNGYLSLYSTYENY
jgi:hypothetical protein